LVYLQDVSTYQAKVDLHPKSDTAKVLLLHMPLVLLVNLPIEPELPPVLSVNQLLVSC
jgi:hypothetical protein